MLPTFKERFDYLKIGGAIGDRTFGSERVFNQKFYMSKEWARVRDWVIVRDNGCDLGIEDRPIAGRIYVHHINPIDVGDIRDATEYLLNPLYLISCSEITHKAIHFGDFELLPKDYQERRPNDTCPWRH